MVAARKRITISLNADDPGDRSILDFLSALPRRARSEVMKEILLEAVQKDRQEGSPNPFPPEERESEIADANRVIDNLF